MGNLELFSAESEFAGWYDAPFPFGRTQFQLKITSIHEDWRFTGSGTDKQGEFTVQGRLVCDDVEFVKDYTDGSYSDIKFKGKVDGQCVSGDYRFTYKRMFINMNICENFWMRVIDKNNQHVLNVSSK